MSGAGYVVSEKGTLRDVFVGLDRGGIRIAIAVDDGVVSGIMTDGDARRALLGGVALDAPIAPLLNRAFTAVESRVARTEVLDLMQARHLDAIPIVDGGVLRGVHQLHDVLDVKERPNLAVIMAGGRGTRLQPITDHVPKPMVRVAGRPIIERLVLALVGFGIRRIAIATSWLGHVIEEHFGEGARFGCRIDYLREETPLGTAGALALLPEQRSPIVVLNGDIVTQADIGSMIDFHERGGHVATLAVRPYSHTVPFGCVTLDGERVTAIEEKPRIVRIINAGMYVVSPSVLAHVAPGEEHTMPGVLASCLARGEGVHAFAIDDDWIDVGRRGELDKARGDG